jgi:hypothetical protein
MELMARIGPEGSVEISDEHSVPIKSVPAMTPYDAAYLARGLLACAVVLSGPPTAAATTGTIIGDAHLPVMRWKVATSVANGEPVLIFSVPSGIELTFQMLPHVAKELGEALIVQSQRSAPPGGQRGTVH